MIRENARTGLPGFPALLLMFVILLASVFGLVNAARGGMPWLLILWVPVIAADLVAFAGLTVVNPNESRVLVLFGTYTGSLKTQGFWWVNPFTLRVTDSGQSSGIGVDKFQLDVIDKYGNLYQSVPSSYLWGGNVVIHAN